MHCHQHLDTYLAIGALAIMADAYLGAAIHGRFCLNSTYHFKVANGWLTDATGTTLLNEFQLPAMISLQAHQHKPV
jgi:hypothetical protein